MDSGVDFRGREWVRNEAKMDPDKDLTGSSLKISPCCFVCRTQTKEVPAGFVNVDAAIKSL